MSQYKFSQFVPVVVLVLSALAGLMVSRVSLLYLLAGLAVVGYLAIVKVKPGLAFALFIGALMVVSMVACDGQTDNSTPSPFVKTDCSSGECIAVSTPVPTPAPTAVPAKVDEQAVAVGKAVDGMYCLFQDPIAAMLGDCSK